jgi:hypothetical protein
LKYLSGAFERPPPGARTGGLGKIIHWHFFGQISGPLSKLTSVGSMQCECGNFANVWSPQKKLPLGTLGGVGALSILGAATAP